LINNVSAKRLIGAQGKYRKAALGLKVFLLLFLQKKKILFFSEEKNQKTFTFWRRVRGSGIWPAKIRRINGLRSVGESHADEQTRLITPARPDTRLWGVPPVCLGVVDIRRPGHNRWY
jgi:hypothetical protein